MHDLLVTENITGPSMDALRRSLDVVFEPELWKKPDELRQRIKEFKGLMVRNQTRVDASLLEAGVHLHIVGRAGVGLDNVEVKAATDRGIVVCYTPEQNSLSVAELTIALMLSLARKITPADASAKSGKWERQKFTGSELFGKRLGLIGMGRIGFLTATRACAFGMEILGYDPQLTTDSLAVIESDAQLVDLDELLQLSDFVSIHVPETPQTMGLMNQSRFSRMKSTAFLINTSRGGVVDEAALVQALRDGKIAGAALDVRMKEPPITGPLESMENVILLPHIGAFTEEGQSRVVQCVCRDVAAVLRGEKARSYVNYPMPRRG
ncbi:MAG TPA: hydroxyacid dehydrogenase [Tepidisphaeraceae bacterium]|nr:hydroxyacid dehydrogenase [Tepidisphaeraceae bacterium]